MTIQARDERKLSQQFAVRLVQLRDERQLGLREAARLIGIDHTRLISFEKGVERTTGNPTLPSPEIVAKMAQVYHVPKEHLLVEAGYVPWVLTPGEGKALVEAALERLSGR
jgi:transcriptional regulator with XRE-family HTH domain